MKKAAVIPDISFDPETIIEQLKNNFTFYNDSYTNTTNTTKSWKDPPRARDVDPDDNYPDEAPEDEERPTVVTNTNDNLPIHFEKYLSNYDDKASLLKFLVGYCSIGSGFPVITFDSTRGVGTDINTLRATIGRNINSHVKNLSQDMEVYYDSLDIDREEFPFNKALNQIKLTSLIEELYLLPRYNKRFMEIDTKEVLLDVISECKMRDIIISPDLDPNEYNFRTLRREGRGISIAYFSNINELIATPRAVRYGPQINLYDMFHNVPPVHEVPAKNKVGELVKINDKEYPRTLVESLIESDLDDFLDNLMVEQYIYDEELGQGAVGPGDTDSDKKVELI